MGGISSERPGGAVLWVLNEYELEGNEEGISGVSTRGASWRRPYVLTGRLISTDASGSRCIGVGWGDEERVESETIE